WFTDGDEAPRAVRRRQPSRDYSPPLSAYKLHAIMVRMKQKRAYRYRFSPTRDQAAVWSRTLGCTRSVDKWAVRLRTDASYARHERLGSHEVSAALTALKQPLESVWRSEVPSVALHQALRHLASALRHFFAGRATYRVVKQNRGRQAATYASSAVRW